MNIQQYIKNLQLKINQLPTIIGNEVVNYSLDSFKKQAWDGSAWKPRKPTAKRNKKRALLVDTGRLRRSIRIRKLGKNFVIVGSNVPYAPAHNQGATFHETVTVSSFTRKSPRTVRKNVTNAKGKTSKRKVKNEKKGTHSVSSHQIKMNTTIPQRQFLGKSKILDARVKKAINNHLKNTSI